MPTCSTPKRLHHLKQFNETGWCTDGIIMLDDIIIEKTGKHIPYAGKFYDHCKAGFVYGYCIINMHYADSKTSYGIDYKLYVKRSTEEVRLLQFAEP